MKRVTRVLLTSFITNIVLALIKVFFGIIAASGALVADGVHSFSDTLTDIFALIGNKLSNKPADSKHPFGHGNIEYITCLLIGIIVLIMGILIIYKAIFSDRTIPSLFVVVVSLFTIMAKLLLANFLLNKGKQYKNNILIASGSESFSDVISSLVVLFSVVIAQFNFIYADMIAMIIIGLLIIKIAFKIFKDNISGLLGEQITDKDYIDKIKHIIYNEKEVKEIESLIILKHGPFYQVTCELCMSENMILKNTHDILDKIEINLKNHDYRLKNIIIHVSPYKKIDFDK